MKFRTTLCALVLAALALYGCASGAQPGAGTPTGASQPQGQEPGPAGSLGTLRVALLSVLDTLPIHVAQQEGLFAKHGVEVEIIPVAAAPDRDQLIAAGQADGMLNEPTSVMLFNRETPQVKIVRYGQAATADRAMFSILAAKDSGIATAADLKGVPIGISQGTVIEYLTDRLLQAEGFTGEEIEGIAVPKISDRMALLGTGELKAGMLPEPLTSLAVQGGAKVVLDDTSHPEYSFSVLSFRNPVIEENPEAIRAFLAAVEEAVGLINADPAKYSTLMADLKLVPQPISGTFTAPTFQTAGVPSEEQWNDVLAWMKEKGLLETDVAYDASVTAEFLP